MTIRAERDLFGLHLVFALAVAVVLSLPIDTAVGVRIAVLVAGYNLAIPLVAGLRGHTEWWRLWTFGAAFSLFMVVPDWFLSAHLGVLEFPPDGLADLGTVTAYMAGLWTIPVMVIVGLARMMEERQGRPPAYLAALFVGAAVFIGAEATAHLYPMWMPTNVSTIGNVAIYIVPAELVLSVVLYAAYVRVRTSNLAVRIATAGLIMVFYLGAAATSWFVLEGPASAGF